MYRLVHIYFHVHGVLKVVCSFPCVCVSFLSQISRIQRAPSCQCPKASLSRDYYQALNQCRIFLQSVCGTEICDTSTTTTTNTFPEAHQFYCKWFLCSLPTGNGLSRLLQKEKNHSGCVGDVLCCKYNINLKNIKYILFISSSQIHRSFIFKAFK